MKKHINIKYWHLQIFITTINQILSTESQILSIIKQIIILLRDLTHIEEFYQQCYFKKITEFKHKEKKEPIKNNQLKKIQILL